MGRWRRRTTRGMSSYWFSSDFHETLPSLCNELHVSGSCCHAGGHDGGGSCRTSKQSAALAACHYHQRWRGGGKNLFKNEEEAAPLWGQEVVYTIGSSVAHHFLASGNSSYRKKKKKKRIFFGFCLVFWDFSFLFSKKTEWIHPVHTEVRVQFKSRNCCCQKEPIKSVSESQRENWCTNMFNFFYFYWFLFFYFNRIEFNCSNKVKQKDTIKILKLIFNNKMRINQMIISFLFEQKEICGNKIPVSTKQSLRLRSTFLIEFVMLLFWPWVFDLKLSS